MALRLYLKHSSENASGRKRNMRRIIAAMLAALIMLILVSCGKTAKSDVVLPEQNISESAQTEENGMPAPQVQTGAWTRPGSTVITDELASLFAKATEELTGAQYIPVAYLGRQIVSGVNHRFICRERIISPDTPETYSIVHIYEDTAGNAEIKDIINTGVSTWISPENASVPGGWAQSISPEITDELEELLENAFEGMLGADHVPIALLSTQTVAGTNYCILCEQTVVYPGASPEYVFIYLYEDLDGNAQITDMVSYSADAADGQ